jgi:LEA14-like dessication related protein
MKKRVVLLVGIVVLIVSVSAYIYLRPDRGKPQWLPSVQISSFRVTNIDAEKIDMLANVTLTNSLPIEFKANDLKYTVLIESKEVINDAYGKPVAVKSGDKTTLTLPMKIDRKKFISVLQEFQHQESDSAAYTFKANFDLDVPLAGRRNFTFDETMQLPVFHVPLLEPENVSIQNINVRQAKVDVEAIVHNPNPFSLSMRNITYHVSVGEDLSVRGVVPAPLQVEAHATATIPVTLDIDTENIGRLAWQSLFKKEDTPFTFNFSGTMMSKNEMLNNSTMDFVVEGTLAELQEAAQAIKNDKQGSGD